MRTISHVCVCVCVCVWLIHKTMCAWQQCGGWWCWWCVVCMWCTSYLYSLAQQPHTQWRLLIFKYPRGRRALLEDVFEFVTCTQVCVCVSWNLGRARTLYIARLCDGVFCECLCSEYDGGGLWCRFSFHSPGMSIHKFLVWESRRKRLGVWCELLNVHIIIIVWFLFYTLYESIEHTHTHRWLRNSLTPLERRSVFVCLCTWCAFFDW